MLEFVCPKEIKEHYVDLSMEFMDKILEKAKEEVKKNFLNELMKKDFDDSKPETLFMKDLVIHPNTGKAQRIGNYKIIHNEEKIPVFNNTYSYNTYDDYYYLK